MMQPALLAEASSSSKCRSHLFKQLLNYLFYAKWAASKISLSFQKYRRAGYAIGLSVCRSSEEQYRGHMTLLS